MNKEKTTCLPAEQRIVSISETISRLLTSDENNKVEVIRHGTLRAVLFTPRVDIPQLPHTQDEIYVVVQGSSDFINGEVQRPVSPGDFLFVPATVEHCFVNFSDDFIAWVIFYGPEGGESSSGENVSHNNLIINEL